MGSPPNRLPKTEQTNSRVTKLDWARDLSVLQHLLADESISEIMINSFNNIFVEREGKVERSTKSFESALELSRVSQALANTIGKELNIRHPLLDATLPDGSRLNAVVPPLTTDGPVITIRKFSRSVLDPGRLVASGSIDQRILFFLDQAVKARQNIVVSGGTGSGKTTLLNLLSTLIPVGERVVTMEDTPELQLVVSNLAKLVCKQETGMDEAIRMSDLLKNALRMRPDRIIIGECRGEEAWDMLQAMNTGHEGSMTTIHANSAIDSLRRLESMVLQSGILSNTEIIKEALGKTLNFIVQTARSSDGVRRVVEIVEVNGMHNGMIQTQPIFSFSDGSHLATGIVPRFAQTRARSFPPGFFDIRFRSPKAA